MNFSQAKVMAEKCMKKPLIFMTRKRVTAHQVIYPKKQPVLPIRGDTDKKIKKL